MKKALSMILVLTMVLALALPAMAAEPDSTTATAPTEASKDVTATYKKESHTETTGDVLYFTITWTRAATQTLKYTGEQATYTWDGANMKYKKNTDTGDGYVAAGWYGSTGYTVEVKNQSNIDLKVTNSASNTYNLGLTQSVDDAGAATYAVNTKVLEKASKDVPFEGENATGTATTVKVSYTYDHVASAAKPDAPTSGETLTVGTLTVKVEKNA